MNIDAQLKQQLQQQADEIDRIVGPDPGLTELLGGSLRSGMRRWVMLGNGLALIATVVIVWTGYRFFTADGIDAALPWAVGLLIAVQMQIAIKQWLWMEAHRAGTLREIKRVEVGLARLSERFDATMKN